MTECRSEKIRNLIITHLGKKELEKYDATVKQCKLGQALKDDRVWAPLCHEYPNLKGVTCEEIDEFLSAKQTLKRGHIGTLETIDDRILLDKDYLHNVKVYDRDEAYEAFKNIGDWIEADTPGILKDPSTIFITTPRGGHEMLSIFAYANDISKEQIPSDITWEHTDTENIIEETPETLYEEAPLETMDRIIPFERRKTRRWGRTWLGDISSTVENIFIVDDIIASGEQIYKTVQELEEMFPDANINSVTLCKRDETSPALPSEINKYYTDTETIGIKEFTKRHNSGELDKKYLAKEYVTCLFPHACPDGDSDKLMIELMGDSRCSPEKRIAKRDL